MFVDQLNPVYLACSFFERFQLIALLGSDFFRFFLKIVWDFPKPFIFLVFAEWNRYACPDSAANPLAVSVLSLCPDWPPYFSKQNFFIQHVIPIVFFGFHLQKLQSLFVLFSNHFNRCMMLTWNFFKPLFSSFLLNSTEHIPPPESETLQRRPR